MPCGPPPLNHLKVPWYSVEDQRFFRLQHLLNVGYTSNFSASWSVTDDGLRRGAGESAQLPTEVKEVLAMFGPTRCLRLGIDYLAGSDVLALNLSYLPANMAKSDSVG